MRFDKLLAGVEAALLAFLLSFSACACLTTAFDLDPVRLGIVALCCALGAVAFSACAFVKYLSFLPMGLLALGLGFLWQRGDLAYAAEALVFQLSAVYRSAYGWNTVSWSGKNLTGVDMTSAIAAIGILIAAVAARTVCRRAGASGAVMAALLPLAACLVVTDRLPAMAPLYTLLLGLTILVLSQTVRRNSIAQGNALTALVAVPAAVGLALLFWAVPQADYQIPDGMDQLFSWVDELVEEAPSSEADLGFDVASEDTVDLAQVGVRIEFRTPVMDVTSDAGGTVYLRGRAYDVYQGDTWQSSAQSDPLYWPDSTILRPAGKLTVSTRSIHQNLYLPYYAGDLAERSLPSPGLGVTNWTKLKTYTFSYLTLPENYAAFQYGYPSQSDGGQYTQLPDETRAWAVALLPEILLPEILQGRDSAVELAAAIAAYVRSSARYSTWPHRMPGDQKDFARWFLEDCDAGYCVHFATAATVLLRAAGIPARYVTGYMVETAPGQTTVVRGENAHAWAEYWVSGIGWMVLEATPSTDTSQSPTGPAQTETAFVPTEETAATTVPTAPSPSETTTPPAATGESAPGDPGDSAKHSGALLKCLAVVGGILLAVAAVFGQWQLRLALWRRRCGQGPVNAQALARWRLVTILARRLKEPPGAALHALAQKAKFSQYTLSQEELAAFDAYIADARNRLRRKPLPMRLLYRFVLALY